MKLSPHLHFKGQCEQAFLFYQHCFGGALPTMLSYGDTPMAETVPAEWRSKIIHATLTFGNNTLMGADVQPDQYEKPTGFQVVLSLSDPQEAERIFAALSENGKVPMPLQQTFWAARFGVLVDQFGIPWEINCS